MASDHLYVATSLPNKAERLTNVAQISEKIRSAFRKLNSANLIDKLGEAKSSSANDYRSNEEATDRHYEYLIEV